MLKRLMIGSALVLAMVGNGFAAEQKSIPVAECGTMWKAHKAKADYVDPGKGERMKAWYEFRKTNCSKDRTAAKGE